MTPWSWHIGTETCRSWYMSQMVFHGVHLLDDTLIDHTVCCANVVTPTEIKNFDKPKSALYILLCCVVLYGCRIAQSVRWPGCRINDRGIAVRLRAGTRDLSPQNSSPTVNFTHPRVQGVRKCPSLWVKRRGRRVGNELHQMPALRISRAIPPVYYARFLASTGIAFLSIHVYDMMLRKS